MLKILYIITQSDWGGAQRYVFDLVTNLQKSQEYQVAVAAGGSGALFSRLGAKNLPVTRLKHLGRSIQPLRDLLAYFELKKLIKTFKPEVVHLNSSKAGVLGGMAARCLGVPKIIYTAHGFVFNEPLSLVKKWLYKKIELFSSKRIDKIIAVSEYDRQTAIAAGIAPEKLITIHNGIDPSSIKFLPKDDARLSLRPRTRCGGSNPDANAMNSGIASVAPHPPTGGAGLPRNDRWIGAIANFYSTKGLDILIRAMKRVEAQLIIIGTGPEKKNLLTLRSLGEGGRLTTYGLRLQKKIFFVGVIPNAATYLKAFDLFVLPSRKEGLPYTLLEAAAAGVPIVATSVGGVPEIIQDGVNGYLAKPDNVNALANAINRGLENPLPPTISGFDLETMLQKTKAIYEE